MALFTGIWNLLKKNPATDGADTFNIETMLNDNWDKLDAALGLKAINADVRAATTGNIALSGLQTIDGVALAEGDRVLVKNQTTASANGIYTATSGAWSRAIDANTDAKLTAGIIVRVRAGNANAGTGWALSNASSVTLGTTALTFVLVFGPGAATDAVIGNRTIDDTIAAAAGADTPTRLWSKLANMVKAITGKSNWYTAPAMTLEAAKSHMDATTGIHGATSSATASTVMQRDAAGRAKVAAPSAADDIARKDTVDAVQTNLTAHIGTGGSAHAAATTAAAGFMSAADKTKLDGIAAGAQVNTVTSVAGKTGAVTLAKGDVGLGNVQNYPIATQAQAEAGTDAASYMTPQRTAQAFDAFATQLPMNMSRQAIINGNFDVWQRGTSFPLPAEVVRYSADHWREYIAADSAFIGTVTSSRIAVYADGIGNSLYGHRTTFNSTITPNTNSQHFVAQPVEYGTRFICGAGKKITMTFWARSSIPNKRIGVCAYQNYGSGGSPTSAELLVGATFTLSTSWQMFSYTFTTNSLSGKTFGSNLDDYLDIRVSYMWGSNIQSRFGATASENVSSSGTVDIAQVQVNAGDTALPFQPRSVSEELALCQRYFEKSYDLSAYPGASNNFNGSGAYPTYQENGTNRGIVCFKTRKRIIPTITMYDPFTGAANKIYKSGAVIDVLVTDIGQTGCGFFPTGSYVVGDDIRFQWTADAEL